MKDMDYILDNFAPVKNQKEATVKASTNDIWVMLRNHYGTIDTLGDEIHSAMSKAKFTTAVVVIDGAPVIKWLMKEKTKH